MPTKIFPGIICIALCTPGVILPPWSTNPLPPLLNVTLQIPVPNVVAGAAPMPFLITFRIIPTRPKLLEVFAPHNVVSALALGALPVTCAY